MADDKTTLEEHEWTYMGRRLSLTDKIAGRWIDHTGEERMFLKPPTGGVVGGRYQVRCSPDGSSLSTGDPKYIGAADRPDDIAEWRLQDRAAYTELEAIRRRRKAASENSDFGDLTLKQVRQQLWHCSPSQKGAVLAQLLGYLEGAR
jgi:hypothetical protein